ncbi:MAG TPA: asparagine synthase C-terminal domain-containing protein [Polyangia bacterium]|nr:asparagine synthase C-terminal domain-containing protein [Polyangia bacterium]
MSPPSHMPLPNVLGDFVIVSGPGTDQWVRGLPGFTFSGDSLVTVAVRGAVHRGNAPDGAAYAALADLIAGQVEEGTDALGAGTPPQRRWRGRFAQVAWNAAERRLVALTDVFSTLPVYVLAQSDVVLVATDVRLLARSPWCDRSIDLEAVYHYLNFAQIPAPRTIFKQVRRLPPATRLAWRPGAGVVGETRYFVPEYPEDRSGSDDVLARELRERIVATVEEYQPAGEPGQGWGCFLSGGTDSSSIVSILARKAGPGRVRSFSIGFAEQGYDELGFARIAATACGANPTFASVSSAEAQALLARVVEAYDQPFANASAIPTLACTELAGREGAQVLLAGDGGDEIYGGNQRYAKDKVMEAWFSMPRPLKALGRVAGTLAGKSSNHFLARVENFFSRASLPNPDRFYTDDSFASDHYDELLTPEFRRAVPRDASLDFMRGVYALGTSGGPLHKIMRLDLNMAIAQSDLPKVQWAAKAAGVTVRFPYLDPGLVELTGHLPETYIVRGLEKRFLFKRAMDGILPEAILKKKKQGFGLPTAVWLRDDAAFKGMVRSVLFDRRARERGWWQPAFLERLLAEHERGTWDHADSIWRIFVLESWLRRYVDAA